MFIETYNLKIICYKGHEGKIANYHINKFRMQQSTKISTCNLIPNANYYNDSSFIDTKRPH